MVLLGAYLTWRELDLASKVPTVTVKAAYSKHRREDVLPLKSSLAQSLARWGDETDGVDRGHRVFASMPDKLAVMLRADLRKARAVWIRATADRRERRKRRASSLLAYRDEAGRVADFHSLRHTFISNLARGGVHPKIAQGLARHSTITLTMDRYTHTVMGELADGLTALPDLTPAHPQSEQQKATGTDGMSEPRQTPSGKRKLICKLKGGETAQNSAKRCDGGDKVSSPCHHDETLQNKGFSCEKRDSELLGRGGVEPPTHGFSVRCSTN